MITTLEANGSGVRDKPRAGVGAYLTLFSVPAKPRGYVLSPVLQKETREAMLLGESHTARSLVPDSQPQTVGSPVPPELCPPGFSDLEWPFPC